MSTVAQYPSHDIFLSHAGAQKDFTKALYDSLRRASFSTFMDTAHHSLPPAEPFPSHIFTAARTCRLAVLVLSEEYVQRKWPMLELCAFLDAPDPKPKILPLFCKLSLPELKDKENQKKWLMAWQKMSQEDPSRPIDLIRWKRALKGISSHNGIPVKQTEGEHAYIKRVCNIISSQLSSSMKHDLSGYQGLSRMSQLVLSKLEGLESGQSRNNVSVLGMHGLPGSGKTSLCKFLCDDLFNQFKDKALLLELPTDPTDQQLLVEAKKLLQSRLTNFNNKMSLKNVSSIEQVYYMLKGTNLSTSRVFLIIDNISSHKSVDLVMALLNLGLGAGSVVLLVARTLDILHPLLQHRGRHQNYVYGNMTMPSLNDTEALRVLLQLEDGSYEPEVDLSPSKRQVMEEVLRMCSNRQGEHLPLVLKIIANQLIREGGLERLKGELEDIDWTEVRLAKEKALQKLLLMSFNALTDKQQELFLDVALFILPLSTLDARPFESQDRQFSEACTLLGHMHGCPAEEVTFELRELQKQCFLTLETWSKRFNIDVHDVYLEFADSIKAASRYLWSSGRRWSKVQREYPGILRQVESPGLRTVVLELLNEQEYYEFPSEFSSVRAMVLRNCKSLRALGLANLKSLASLEIRDCPSLRWVDQPYLRESLRQVKWVNSTVEVNHHEYLAVGQSSWHQQWFPIGRPERAIMELGGLVMQMKALQVLQLVNTGIRMSQVNISGMLQLRVVEVRERHIEHFHACNLPNLKRLLFFGDGKEVSTVDHNRGGLEDEDFNSAGAPLHLIPKAFWAGCPQLEDVYVRCASSEGITPASSSSVVISARPRLKSLRVNHFWNLVGRADLNASADSLENLTLGHCQDIKSLAFGCVYGNLTRLFLWSCPNLIEVTGLQRLPSLLYLKIKECNSLKSVSGLAALASLELCTLDPVPEGVSVSEFANLTKLEKIDVVFTCTASSLAAGKQFNMRNLVNLKFLYFQTTEHVLPAGMLTGIEGLWNLVHLKLKCNYSEYSSDSADQLCNYSEYSSDSADQLADLATLLGVAAMPSKLSNLDKLDKLELWGVENLTSLNGIEFLVSLETLFLFDLRNLSCLRGIESLKNLEGLIMMNCASVEELPSLARLASLTLLSCDLCVNLRIVHRPGLPTNALEIASFVDCRSLGHLPFDLEDLKQSELENLRIEGSKFASVEALVAWVQNEEVPQPLRRASLSALSWELTCNLKGRKKEEMVLKLLHAVRRLALEKYAPLQNVGDQDADDVDHLKAKHHQHPATLCSVLEKPLALLHKRSWMDCIGADHEDDNIVEFKEYWNLLSRMSRVLKTCEYSHEMFPAEAVEEALQQVASVPKECIIRHCRSNPNFQLLVFLLYTSLYDSPSDSDESFCPKCWRDDSDKF